MVWVANVFEKETVRGFDVASGTVVIPSADTEEQAAALAIEAWKQSSGHVPERLTYCHVERRVRKAPVEVYVHRCYQVDTPEVVDIDCEF